MRKSRSVKSYEPELYEMYGVRYEIIATVVPHNVARFTKVRIKCPIHGEEREAVLNNLLAYRYRQYDIKSSAHPGKQTVCTFPCQRCRELKHAPVERPFIKSEAGKEQAIANMLFSTTRKTYEVKYVSTKRFSITCPSHGYTIERSKAWIKENPHKVCGGCRAEHALPTALVKIGESLGDMGYRYEVVGTRVHVLDNGLTYDVVKAANGRVKGEPHHPQ